MSDGGPSSQHDPFQPLCLASIAERTEGYTGADLEDLVRRAGLHALRDDLDVELVPMRHFESALQETRASVTPETEREYEQLRRELKQESPWGPRRIGFRVARDGAPEERVAARATELD